MRWIGSTFVFVLTVAAAVVIGFGVPLAWVWIGSQLQSGRGATSVSFSVAMAILFGIIITYFVLLYLAGIVMARFGAGSGQQATARAPWMRGMTDTRQRAQRRPDQMGGIERLFVVTTMLVAVAFWIWFAVAAGSPLPNQ